MRKSAHGCNCCRDDVTMPLEIDDRDVQGLVRFGYGDLTEACFYLLEVQDRVAARAWLSSRSVTSAVKVPRSEKPEKALQVAFSWDGLKALGIPPTVEGLSLEFISGMAGDESRSRRLGDVDASAPSTWSWGGPGRAPHVLVMLYARAGRLESWKQEIRGGTWMTAFRETLLSTSNLDNVEPFGFRDGISQPELDWEQRRTTGGNEVRFTNRLALGEFLLGYPNEYGKYTERPLVAMRDDPQGILPIVEGDSGRRDFGRNGTYLVFRDIRQDVRSFWRFLDAQAGGDRTVRDHLGAAMVGRTKTGEPLVALADHEIDGTGGKEAAANRFTYDADHAGTRCPIGAHIRRANPRTGDYPAGTTGLVSRLLRLLGFGGRGFEDDLIASARFHRILRRGREYGPGLSPEDALLPGRDEDRGLRFICLNANIGRQFEFVQNAWIMGTKFAGLTEERDAIIGSRQPIPGCPATDNFSIPREGGVARRIAGIPAFVTVRGGGYFFLPSLRALRYLASLRT
jgi:deferrochelatase/peroxidase EfeB